MTNGRAKGSIAEREVVGIVQPWWRQLEPEATFVRTPLSGGWGGPTVRKAFQAAGDLMTTAKWFPYAVEVKRREGWEPTRMMAGKPSPVWGWWVQCQKAAAEMGKVPQLWFRRSRERWLVMMPSECASFVTPVALRWPVGLPSVNHGAIIPSVWDYRALLRSDPLAHLGLEALADRASMRGVL